MNCPLRWRRLRSASRLGPRERGELGGVEGCRVGGGEADFNAGKRDDVAAVQGVGGDGGVVDVGDVRERVFVGRGVWVFG